MRNLNHWFVVEVEKFMENHITMDQIFRPLWAPWSQSEPLILFGRFKTATTKNFSPWFAPNPEKMIRIWEPLDSTTLRYTVDMWFWKVHLSTFSLEFRASKSPYEPLGTCNGPNMIMGSNLSHWSIMDLNIFSKIREPFDLILWILWAHISRSEPLILLRILKKVIGSNLDAWFLVDFEKFFKNFQPSN